MKMPTTLKDYEVLENIGEGSYGVCRKVRRKKDGKILVWKELDYGCMTETEKQLLVSEVNLLRELRHKYIVCYHDRIIDRTSSKLYIIMEYCEGGDVSSLIKKLKKEGKRIEESAVWKICTQVLLALQECHSRSKNGKVVLHRDLKPANVFLDSDMNVKLGDFGLARVLSHETSFARTYVGTPYYMSPEQMNRMSYNEKSDVWSLGCLLYELTALKPPFTASGIHELTSKINQGRFARIPFRYSDDLNNLISNILQVDECGRPGVEELLREPLIRHQVALLQPAAASSSHSAPPRARPASLHGSDEGYESLKRREEAIIQQEEAIIQQEKALAKKERLLQEKQKDLEQRELALDTREQNVREEIMKMERLSLALRSGEGGEMLCVRPSPRASDCGTVSTPAAADTFDVQEETFSSADKNNSMPPNFRRALSSYSLKFKDSPKAILSRKPELNYQSIVSTFRYINRRNSLQNEGSTRFSANSKATSSNELNQSIEQSTSRTKHWSSFL